MTATRELGDRMASVANVVCLMFGNDKHDRFLKYAIRYEFEGEEPQLPQDVREMLLQAEGRAMNALPLPRAGVGVV